MCNWCSWNEKVFSNYSLFSWVVRKLMFLIGWMVLQMINGFRSKNNSLRWLDFSNYIILIWFAIHAEVHTSWKSRCEVLEIFAKFYIGGQLKFYNIWHGIPSVYIFSFLFKSFETKFLGVLFYTPSSPSLPSQCTSLFSLTLMWFGLSEKYLFLRSNLHTPSLSF